MVRAQHPQLRELARRVDELSAPESQTGEQTEISNALFRLANEDETWEKAFGWVLSECVPTRELVKNAATVGDTVRWLKGRVETAERLERETAKSAPVSPADPVPLNAVRAAIEAISTGRPANALENLRVLEMHLRAHRGVVPMILHCPRCRMQHIDEPWHPGLGCRRERDNRDLDRGGTPISIEAWQNPPHRSHLCAGCGFIWRPADVPTTGVAAITTRGQNDSDPVSGKALTLREFAMQVLGYTEEYVDEVMAYVSAEQKALTYIVLPPELTEAQRAGVEDYVKRNSGSVVRAISDNGSTANIAPMITDAQVQRACETPMPGGAKAWHWVFGGGVEIEDSHREWFRRVLFGGMYGVAPMSAETDQSLAAAQEDYKTLAQDSREMLRGAKGLSRCPSCEKPMPAGTTCGLSYCGMKGEQD